MGQRLPIVLGVALTLVAAACRSGSSDERPVAKPGRVVTVTDQDDLDGSGLHVVFDLEVGPDGTLYAIDDIAATIRDEPGYVHNLWAIPPRGPARLLAGIPMSRLGFRSVDPADVIDPSPRLRARSLFMFDIAIGPDGTLFVGDHNNNVVWALARDGSARVVAGTGEKGYSGDGGTATAAMIDKPVSLVANQGTGDLYIATSDSRIRRVDAAGVISTVAGDGTVATEGDGGLAVDAQLREARSMAVDPRNGDLYFCDVFFIRRIDSAGKISSVAGNGTAPNASAPPGRPATEGPVDCDSVAVDPRDGVVYFSGSESDQIRRINPARLVEVVAGNGEAGLPKDGTPAINAPISPSHLAIDRQGHIFFAGQTLVANLYMIGAEPPLI